MPNNNFHYEIESIKRVPFVAFSYSDIIKEDLMKEIKNANNKEIDSSPQAVIVNCDDIFKSVSHFYPQVLETKIVLGQLLEYKPKHLKYAGIKFLFKFVVRGMDYL